MENLTDETLIQLQQVFQTFVSGTESEYPQAQKELQKILRENLSLLGEILRAVELHLGQLPENFLLIFGQEFKRVLAIRGVTLDEESLNSIESFLYRASQDGKWDWLAILAGLQNETAMDLFVREIVESKPDDIGQVVRAFEPLMKSTDFEIDWLFPGLFEGLHQVELAPVILDFANYCIREDFTDEHPAIDKKQELRSLLAQLVKRMNEIESDPTSWSVDPVQTSRIVNNSVWLIVSLCDTLTLMKDADSIEVLKQTNELKHRRIRSEASFALARLGDETGKQNLLELAADPVSRIRSLQYASELGMTDEIDEGLKSDVAIAESRLAMWLAQPGQMGIAPSQIELIDERTLFWPGFDEPVDCFLFRFRYQHGEKAFSNIGIVGPLIHTFLSNLEDLSMDDVYAAFAGWQAEHDEIFELDLKQLSPYRKTDLFKLERRATDFGCTQVQPEILAQFFGEVILVAKCNYEDHASTIYCDAQSLRVFPNRTGSLHPSDVFCIYKGRKLLEAFNVESQEAE